MEGNNDRPDTSGGRAIRVAVVDENDIFRRGVHACLDGDRDVKIIFDGPAGPVPGDVDVVIASDRAAAELAYPGPTLVCSDVGCVVDLVTTRGNVVAILPRGQLTESQLCAAVHAAASGLRVGVAGGEAVTPPVGLPERSLQILRLLAAGYGTREISDTVGCSERTVKYGIRDVEHQLEARSRAHVVAEAIRQGLI